MTGSGFVSGSTTVDFGTTAGTSVDVTSGALAHRQRPVGDRHGLGDRHDHRPVALGHTRWPTRYTYNAAPTVTSVSPNNGPQAGTNTVTVAGSGFVSGSTTVDFGTNAGTSVDVAGGATRSPSSSRRAPARSR